ncbi:hypothetical protein GCM10009846_26430 [Agrococcus versicolor]|uniref:Uncharacterized protein n=1 Tax=Agrococcus versicolor TaxID=501482 RepID=A0ABN3AWF3_9MICO
MKEHVPWFTRVSKPAPPRGLDGVSGSARQQVGGEWHWDWGIPLVYRALQAPYTGSSMPIAPSHQTVDEDAVGYWNALHHVLTYSLGWARHDWGLRWWYDSGKPTNDPRLALVDAIWESDGLLNRYLGWAHDKPGHTSGVFGSRGDDSDDAERWSGTIVTEREVGSGGDSPWGKHLEGHWSGPLDGDPERRLSLDRDSRRAVLMCESASGWTTALREAGGSLPVHRNSAWRIDVVVKPIGFLGTYRKSWQTGIWFAGGHELHSRGN